MKRPNYQKMSIHDYFTGRFTAKSAQSMIGTVQLFLTWVEQEGLEPEQVTYQDLLAYMKHCTQRGASQRTVQNYLGAIGHYYNYLAEQQRITTNPVTGIEVKGVKRKVLYQIFEPHELHQLYHQYQNESLKGRRNRAMLGLLVYQGLKTEELARLQISHIKLREGTIDVPGGKKSEGRVLQLEAHQVMDLYDYILQIRPQILALSGQQTEKLLVSPAGGTQVSNFMTQLMIKVRRINPSVQNAKQIRASVITKWLKRYNLRKVQYLAGHRYVSTTESYLQNDMEGLKEEVQQFHPLG